jgi:hypothetical protein
VVVFQKKNLDTMFVSQENHMHKKTWLFAILTLFLAAALTLAEVGSAQAQGGQRRGGAAQGAGTGWGAGNPNRANLCGPQSCPVGGPVNTQTQTRSRKRYRGNAPQASSSSTPQTQNPTPQSGN